MCEFFSQLTKDCVFSIQFVYELKLTFRHQSLQVHGRCSRGRNDALKKRWSTGILHLLVRHFQSRVPLYFSLNVQSLVSEVLGQLF